MMRRNFVDVISFPDNITYLYIDVLSQTGTKEKQKRCLNVISSRTGACCFGDLQLDWKIFMCCIYITETYEIRALAAAKQQQ